MNALDRCAPEWFQIIDAHFRPPNFVFNGAVPGPWVFLMQQAKQNTENGNIEEALRVFQEAMAYPGISLEAVAFSLAGIALALIDSNRLSEAFAYAEKCAALLPDREECATLLAYLWVRQRNWPNAIPALERAAELGNSLTSAFLALLYTICERYAEAEVAAKRALALGIDFGAEFTALSLWCSQMEQGKSWEGSCFFEPDEPGDMEQVYPRLPQCTSVYESPNFRSAKLVVYTLSDAKYFNEYTVATLVSVAQTSTQSAIHVHVVNPDEGVNRCLQALTVRYPDLPIKITAESGYLPPQFVAVYCSNIRFIRCQHAMQGDERPYVLIDGDSVFNRDPMTLFGDFAHFDLGLIMHEHEPAWARCSAACVVVAPTAAGRDFFRRVAWFIWQHLERKRCRWFVDQIALFWANRNSNDQLRIAYLDKARYCNTNGSDDAILWTFSMNKNESDHPITLRIEALKASLYS